MEIKTLDVQGFLPAMKAMRNPLQSWSRSDSLETPNGVFIGSADKTLSQKLQNAGPEHCKHLRMIIVWADITAPLTWHKQFDTYRIGVEKVSTSTMHKLMARPLTEKDFAAVKIENREYWSPELLSVITMINRKIEKYKVCDDSIQKKLIWQEAVDLLPESYLQTRTIMMSYASIRNIVRQREGHKLGEWKQFIDWAHTLPESWMIFDE